MNLSSFNSLQKLRYFLAGVFPFLARAPWPRAAVSRLLARYPRVALEWEKARLSLLGGHAEKVAGTFAVGEYANDVLDWTKIPQESVGILRAGVIVAALLCLLLPLATVVDWPPISVESITDVADRGTVGGWAIVLWIAALALGWAAMLIGAAGASRVAFIPSLAAFLYLNLATVAALPKSWWSLLVPIQGVAATIFCEWRARREGTPNIVAGIVTSLLAGAGTGFVGTIVIPTAPWFRGRIPFAIAAVGVPLGLAAWLLGRWLRRRAPHPGDGTGRGSSQAFVTALTLCGVVIHLVLAVRGGLQIPAQGVAGLATQMTGYLWPLYYFIGVGVVFKVLRQTKTLQRAAQELIPLHIAIPGTIAILVFATVASWAPAVLRTPGLPWPWWLVQMADALSDTFSAAWSTEVARRTTETMRWVVLGLAVSTWWASRRGRLTAAAIARVQVLALAGWFAIAEYHMELLGIARSPRVSATALFLFSIFILWILHRTMVRFLTGDSPWWPRPARTALYAAALMFVLLPVAARGAMHDPRLSGEIVFYLFQGVLTFGVPYYLFVYAARRFTVLPITPQVALALFLLGGGLAAVLVVFDKAVVAGSFVEAWGKAGQEVADGIAGRRSLPTTPVLPSWWIACRGVLAMLAVLAIMRAVRRRTRVVILRPAAAVFSAMAVATGLACFSNRSLDLPLLPSRVSLLLTPLHTSLWIDERFIALQLSYLLPALLLAYVATSERSMRRSAVAVAAAVALHVGLGLVWPGGEPWLRSTGILGLMAAGGICAFLLAASALRERLDELLLRKRDGNPAEVTATDHLLDRRELRIVAATVLLVAISVGATRVWTARLVPRSVPEWSTGIPVPAAWQVSGVGFLRTHASGDTARLEVRQHADSTEPIGAIQGIALAASETFPGFTPAALERWDHVVPGAVALDFTWLRQPNDSNTYALGTLAIADLPNGQLAVVTVTYGTLDLARRWDVARVLQSLPQPAPVAKR